MGSPSDRPRLLLPRPLTFLTGAFLIGTTVAAGLLATSAGKAVSLVLKPLEMEGVYVSASYPLQRPRSASKPAKGKFLVASRDLADPNFVETVILLLDYNEKGAMGVVINRNADVRLSELLPDLEALRGRTETVFRGGPVGRDSLMILVRSRELLREAQHVFADVYVTSSRELLEELAAEADGPRYRAYVGYAGWGAGQLDFEVETGSWHIVPAQAATVFDPAPAQIWKQLIRSLSMQFARLSLPEARNGRL